MEMDKLQLAHLTESELQKIKETEIFLNRQPDHRALQEKGYGIYLLAFVEQDNEKNKGT